MSERLRQVLQRHRMTARALAFAVGLKDQTVSRYLHGTATPRPRVQRAIADVLHAPLSFFFHPVPAALAAGSAAFFRSYAAATKRARMSAATVKDWTREITSYVAAHVDLPPVDVPEFGVSDDPASISWRDVEHAAEETRRHWGLGGGPIANVVRLLEHQGAIVVRHDFGVDTLDAFSQWGQPEDRPFIVLGAARSATRSRFDAAHELGHMVLHRHLPPEVVARPELHNLLERQAHRFAGAFLMPAETFRQSVYLTTLPALLELKGVWLVTVAAMLMRLSDLELVSERQTRRLWQLYAPWRRAEPRDNELQLEMPSTLRESFEIIVGEVGLLPEQVAAELPFGVSDLQALGGLPLGFFERERRHVRPRRASHEATVLPFLGPEGLNAAPSPKRTP